MNHLKLYKRRQDGKINVWWAEVEDCQYRTHAGILDGAIVTSAWTTCSAKRGTTPQSQAASEVVSMYKLKQDRGYSSTVDGVDDAAAAWFRPMLAEKFPERVRLVQSHLDAGRRVYIQPKLDGMRCIAQYTGLWSRKGKPVKSAPHIYEAIFGAHMKDPHGHMALRSIFDGELYANKFAKDFNAIISLARKTVPNEHDLAESAEYLQYHVYDLPSPHFAEQRFIRRYTQLKKFVEAINHPAVKLVKTYRVKSFEEIDTLTHSFLKKGYEGSIIRLDEPYVNRRTTSLLKYKNFQEEEFCIQGVEEGNGNRSGMVGCLHLVTQMGKEFRAAVMGTNAYRIDMLARANELIGKLATVRYQNITPAGVPRMPVVKAIRDYE